MPSFHRNPAVISFDLRFLVYILGLWLCGRSWWLHPIKSPPEKSARLVLQDFETITQALAGVTMSGWSAGPKQRSGRVWYEIAPARRLDGNRALHLYYRFDPQAIVISGCNSRYPM